MGKPAVRRALLTLGAVALGLAVLIGLAVAWLSSAPIEAAPLRPVVERVLAGQVEGGRAEVGRVQVVRFPEDGALGVRLHDVNLVDARNRSVLRARLVEAGLGTDALLLFSAAPSRLVVHDFFVAASVSPQGRYALGYEAKGPPPPLDPKPSSSPSPARPAATARSAICAAWTSSGASSASAKWPAPSPGPAISRRSASGRPMIVSTPTRA
ncbi:MAG TPA: hypothetical protein VD906_15525 [Caulobacteraceae bacterium]|nr:hypothetical protein [Caulobacteraceae bacterium]